MYELETEIDKMVDQKYEMEDTLDLIEDLTVNLKNLPKSKERTALIDSLEEESFTIEDELTTLKEELEELQLVLFEIQEEERRALEKEYWDSVL